MVFIAKIIFIYNWYRKLSRDVENNMNLIMYITYNNIKQDGKLLYWVFFAPHNVSTEKSSDCQIIL